MQQQQNSINDLIRAADGLQNLNTNANAQQLQNTQQHEYLWQAFPATSPAANRVAPSNETTASSKFHNCSMWLICCFLFIFIFSIISFSV